MASTLLYLSIYFDNKLVAGEGTAKDYENRVEIESFSWGLTAKHERGQGKRVVTAVKPDMLVLKKFFDKASISLLKAVKNAEGQKVPKPFSTARLQFADMVRVAGQPPKKIMELVLKDGYVEKVTLDAGATGKGMSVRETVSLSFTKLDILYYPKVLAKDTRGPACIFQTSQPCVID